MYLEHSKILKFNLIFYSSVSLYYFLLCQVEPECKVVGYIYSPSKYNAYRSGCARVDYCVYYFTSFLPCFVVQYLLEVDLCLNFI